MLTTVTSSTWEYARFLMPFAISSGFTKPVRSISCQMSYTSHRQFIKHCYRSLHPTQYRSLPSNNIWGRMANRFYIQHFWSICGTRLFRSLVAPPTIFNVSRRSTVSSIRRSFYRFRKSNCFHINTCG